MADKFLQHDGIETGYFSKRKAQFNNEIAKGIASTGVQSKVTSKPKHKTDTKKAPVDTPPSQLKGNEFYEKMKAAKEAKAKESKGTEV